jgi:lipoate synthase
MNRATSYAAAQAQPQVRSSYHADEQRHAATSGRGAIAY